MRYRYCDSLALFQFGKHGITGFVLRKWCANVASQECHATGVVPFSFPFIGEKIRNRPLVTIHCRTAINSLVFETSLYLYITRFVLRKTCRAHCFRTGTCRKTVSFAHGCKFEYDNVYNNLYRWIENYHSTWSHYSFTLLIHNRF